MAVRAKDPTEPIRRHAGRYAGVDEGTACTQSSFKAGKKAFLFIGPQGGRYKAMFKLGPSLPQATKLAKADPDRYQVGSTAWVTTRFTAEKPLPKTLWKKWLDESYELSAAAQPAKKRATKKPATKKAAAAKKTARKSAPKKKAVKKRATKK